MFGWLFWLKSTRTPRRKTNKIKHVLLLMLSGSIHITFCNKFEMVGPAVGSQSVWEPCCAIGGNMQVRGTISVRIIVGCLPVFLKS